MEVVARCGLGSVARIDPADPVPVFADPRGRWGGLEVVARCGLGAVARIDPADPVPVFADPRIGLGTVVEVGWEAVVCALLSAPEPETADPSEPSSVAVSSLSSLGTRAAACRLA